MCLLRGLVALCAALFVVSCSSSESEDSLYRTFVTDVAFPTGSYAPGDRITVSAQGFETSDQIMFELKWPTSSASSVTEGYAKGIYAVIQNQSTSSISFIAPGGYPAATVEVLLFRGGHLQSLGKMQVSNGLPPSEFALYGVSHAGGRSSIERIDLTTGAKTSVAQIEGTLRHAVPDVGTNRIYGIADLATESRACFYDLTMRYVNYSLSGEFVAAGVLGYAIAEDNNVLTLWTAGSLLSRTPNFTPRYTLPEGLTSEMLTCYPFVYTGEGLFIFSADLDNGTFAPVFLGSSNALKVGDAVAAEAMIPFVSVQKLTVNGQTVTKLLGGCVISTADGQSKIQYLQTGGELAEPLATVAGLARSVTVDLDTRKFYLLLQAADGSQHISVYDEPSGTWSQIAGTNEYAEIVVAR